MNTAHLDEVADRCAESAVQTYLARLDRTDDLMRTAHLALRSEFLDALANEPARIVRTPGFGTAHSTARYSAADVIFDNFSAASGDASLHELLRIVALCANGKADNELHLRASAWVAGEAKLHADFHASDLVDSMLGLS